MTVTYISNEKQSTRRKENYIETGGLPLMLVCRVAFLYDAVDVDVLLLLWHFSSICRYIEWYTTE